MSVLVYGRAAVACICMLVYGGEVYECARVRAGSGGVHGCARVRAGSGGVYGCARVKGGQRWRVWVCSCKGRAAMVCICMLVYGGEVHECARVQAGTCGVYECSLECTHRVPIVQNALIVHPSCTHRAWVCSCTGAQRCSCTRIKVNRTIEKQKITILS